MDKAKLEELLTVLERAATDIAKGIEPLCDDKAGFRSLPFNKIGPTVESAYMTVKHNTKALEYAITELKRALDAGEEEKSS